MDSKQSLYHKSNSIIVILLHIDDIQIYLLDYLHGFITKF